MQTIKVIQDGQARQQGLRYMARAVARAGGVRKALEIVGGIPASKDRCLALQEISEAQAEAGDRVGALATIRLATEIDVVLDRDALGSLAGTRARMGDVQGAIHWVNDRSTPETRPWGLLGIASGMLPRSDGPSLQLHSQ